MLPRDAVHRRQRMHAQVRQEIKSASADSSPRRFIGLGGLRARRLFDTNQLGKTL
jgi:hypothetical protein